MNIDKDALSRYMPEIARKYYEKHKDTLSTYSVEQLQKDIAEAKEYAKSPDKCGSDFKNSRLLYPKHIENEVAFKQEELQDLWDRQDFDTYIDMYCKKLLQLANYNARRLMIDDDEHFTLKNRNVHSNLDVLLGIYSSGFSVNSALGGRTGGFPYINNTYEYYNNYVLLFLLESYISNNDYGLLETAAAIGSSFNPTHTSDLHHIQLFRLYIYSCKLFHDYNCDTFINRYITMQRLRGSDGVFPEDNIAIARIHANTMVLYGFQYLDGNVTDARGEADKAYRYFDEQETLLRKK